VLAATTADRAGAITGEDVPRPQGGLNPVGSIIAALALGLEAIFLAVGMEDRSTANITLAPLEGGLPHPTADVGFSQLGHLGHRHLLFFYSELIFPTVYHAGRLVTISLVCVLQSGPDHLQVEFPHNPPPSRPLLRRPEHLDEAEQAYVVALLASPVIGGIAVPGRLVSYLESGISWS
jgi:hypothetical protein